MAAFRKVRINGNEKQCSRCEKFYPIRDETGKPVHEYFRKHNKDNDESWQTWCVACKKTSRKPKVENATPAVAPAVKRSVGRPRKNPIVQPTQPIKRATVAKNVNNPVAAASAPVVVNNGQAAVQQRYQFIDLGDRFISLDDVSVVDRVANDTAVEIVMRSTEMSNQGVVHSRVYFYNGAARDAVLSAIASASGKPPQHLLDRIAELESRVGTLEVVNQSLDSGNQRLSAERDAAMQLAAELEEKINRFKAML